MSVSLPCPGTSIACRRPPLHLLAAVRRVSGYPIRVRIRRGLRIGNSLGLNAGVQPGPVGKSPTPCLVVFPMAVQFSVPYFAAMTGQWRTRVWLRRLLASPLAALFFVSSAVLGFEDPSCPHHRMVSAGQGGHGAGIGIVQPDASPGHHGHAAGAEADGSGGNHPCSCAGLCQVGGSLHAFDAPSAAAAVGAAPIAVVALISARRDPLPPPPDHLFPYATAPPVPPSV